MAIPTQRFAETSSAYAVCRCRGSSHRVGGPLLRGERRAYRPDATGESAGTEEFPSSVPADLTVSGPRMHYSVDDNSPS